MLLKAWIDGSSCWMRSSERRTRSVEEISPARIASRAAKSVSNGASIEDQRLRVVGGGWSVRACPIRWRRRAEGAILKTLASAGRLCGGRKVSGPPSVPTIHDLPSNVAMPLPRRVFVAADDLGHLEERAVGFGRVAQDLLQRQRLGR